MFRIWICLIALHLPAQHIDRILVNGRIWTGESRQPYAEAIAISGDRFSAVGTTAEIRALASPDTAVLDLKGKFVAPGFNDAHWHVGPSNSVDLTGSATTAEIVARLRDAANNLAPGAWLRGQGWVYTMFPERKPHRKYLDAAFSDRPVLIIDRDGHQALANSEALRRAAITRDRAEPPHSRIIRDEGGEPTGELQELAMNLVSRVIPPISADERYATLRMRMKEAAAFGLTSLQIASGYEANGKDQAMIERALAEGALKQRLYVTVPFEREATQQQIEAYVALSNTYRGPLLRYGAAKGAVDGTVDGRTAAMLEPFVGGGTGIPNFTEAELTSTVARYDKAGLQIWLHAIGDRAIRMSLNAYEGAIRTNGTSGRRHRIEHIEVPHPSDIPRFAKLGVIASTQAAFAEPDESSVNNYVPLLGPDRARRAMPFRQLDERGAVQAFGSDHPVFSMDVLRGIYVAATRTTPEGKPAGGWMPDSRISVEAALRHFTVDAAYASFEESQKGTIAPGKLADLVVLSRNILQGSPNELLSTKVLLTIMGGRDTHRASAF